MGDTNVVTHANFALPAEQLEKLRGAGVDVHTKLSQAQIDELGLKEPQYGEATAGELTDDEAALFYALWQAKQGLEDRTRTLVGDAITKVGGEIRDSDRNKSMQDVLGEDGPMGLDFANDELAEEYFAVQQKSAYLHALFYWMIGERLGKHSHRLGVRSKMRVVTLEQRY